ncbi:MAG: FecR family protein [Ferrovibrio sp.]|uniref:FecR family protein n=1 Tax=Ferrovibrio sp. TaxID=1917215 RepID=UPI00262AC10B|nr:FecR family protein [Ferrovibrio sp.]MCW0234729.1 FecR family protein [Ferrovibrio sp.]
MDFETGDAVLQEAQQWFVLLRDDAVSEADHQRFSAWLAASPAHRQAWEETGQLWTRMDAVVPALQLRERLRPAAPAPARGMLSRRGWLQQAAAATLVLGGGAYLAASPDMFADHRTAVGERRRIDLPDGSQVELAADTAISVTMESGLRRIALHRGQAYFQVASDAARPFVVAAGNGEIRALGTAFDVRIGQDDVRVAVSEHAVAVTVDGGRETIRLGEGNALQFGRHGIGPAVPADIASVLAWRQDRLFFQEAPLAEVVADLDRYRPGRIVIADAGIAALPVTGFFHAAQAEAALQTIAATLPVRLTRLTDRLVIIRAR